MAKSHLIKKYYDLVQQEEKRIRDATRERFLHLRHLDSHPSLVIGTRYNTHKHDKMSYSYLRQRYYRLKRIETPQIIKATRDYAFDSWFNVITNFTEHYGLTRDSTYQELLKMVMSMTEQEKEKFIDVGFNYNLRDEYLDMGDDLRNDSRIVFTHIIERIRQVKNSM